MQAEAFVLPTPKAAKERMMAPHSPVKKRNVGVPKFLRFLYEILEKEDKSIICWSHKGTAFQIRKPDALSKGILPRYFKHNKVSSFQRQLNYFGFKKWTKTQTVVCTFSHPHFIHHKPENMKLIKRKERGLTDDAKVAKAAKLRPAMTDSPTPWTFPTAPPPPQYDFFFPDNDLDKKWTTLPSTSAANNTMHLVPMHISTQIQLGADEWGDVLLSTSGDATTATDDTSTYFDLWDEDPSTSTSFSAPSITVGPFTQAMMVTPLIKHEQGAAASASTQTLLVSAYENETVFSSGLPLAMDGEGAAATDDDEAVELKSQEGSKSPSLKSPGRIASAWPQGPRIDVDHYEFTKADYAHRVEAVAAMRERFRIKSQPGYDMLPKPKRTVRTIVEQYARSNLYFLPFVKVTLTDAIWDGDLVNVARLLVKRIPPDSRDKNGRLGLSIAIQLRHVAIAKFLIDKHAKVDLQDEGTLFGPLHMSIIMGNKSMTRRLIEGGATVDLRDAEGMTPLHWAAIRGYLEIVGLLLHHGADVNGQDKTGMTALHIACFKGYMDLVEFLLHTGHADIDIEDENGFPPGLYARIEDQGEVLDRIDEYLSQLKKDAERRERRAKRRAERLAKLEAESNSLI
ncbi:unnamed protein product [Aphanomyces euteiches]